MNKLKSIAFIPDGNRRYAKKVGIPITEAYMLGTKNTWKIIEWLKKFNETRFLTFYALSYENFKRKKNELKILSKLFEKEIDSAFDTKYFQKNNFKLKFIGRINEFPKRLFNKMISLQDETANNTKKIISLALGYDGQKEIIDATKAIALNESRETIENLNEKKFRKHLYAEIPAPDLIIRTSGTQRLSGFLLFNSSYSELYFSQKLWPEFNKRELNNAIKFYKLSKRNFGK